MEINELWPKNKRGIKPYGNMGKWFFGHNFVGCSSIGVEIEILHINTNIAHRISHGRVSDFLSRIYPFSKDYNQWEKEEMVFWPYLCWMPIN